MSDLYDLPNGWEWSKLNEVFIVKDGTHDSPKYIEDDGYPLFTSKNLKGYGLDKNNFKLISEDDYNKINKRSKVDKGDLLFAMIGTIGNPTIIDYEPNFSIKNVALFKPKDEGNIIELLRYYFLSNTIIDKMLSEAKGATQKFVGLTYLRNFQYPKLPLSEQHRIVSKLDKLFEKIDKSIALHQQNMDEADVFMGSVLNDVFVELEEMYGLKQIRSLFKIKSGDFLPKKKMIEDGIIDVYGGNGINGRHNEFNLSGENVIIGRVGALCGNVRCIDGNIWLTDNAFFVSEYFESIEKNYLTQMLIHIDLGSSANQSAQPVISYKGVSELELPLPPLNIQQKVAKYLDKISTKLEKVKSVQKEKMDSLIVLKASILDKTFRGEL